MLSKIELVCWGGNKIMGETQLGVELSNEDVDAIVTFFKALDGKMPNITYPHLPAVTASTPKPEAK